jgi:glycosyltransferase involved in cell wall biosynthesis
MQPILASVVLLTYNQEAFVKEALQSLLDQDYDNLEIVVSDDGSKDGTWRVLTEVVSEYKGKKPIILNRNEVNLGVVGNYYKAFGLSSGDLIFTAAGDDISLPTRCSACVEYWISCGRKPDLIAADAYDMSIDGNLLGTKQTDNLEEWDLIRWAERRPYMFGASHMMTRRLIGLRTLNARLSVEDQNFVIRALMMGGAHRLPQLLVKHRRGGLSQTKIRWNYELKKTAMIKSSHDALIVIDEISIDAQVLGINVEHLLTDQRALNTYALDIFSCVGILDKIRFTVAMKKIKWSKRLKFFSFATFTYLHRFSFFTKSFFLRR